MRRLARSCEALLAILFLAAEPAEAQQRVSLELVLAIDTSLSVDDQEYAQQMQGLAEAIRTPEVIELIGRHQGGVAVGLLQWSGIADTESVRWRLLTDAGSIRAYAAEIGSTRRWPYGYLTGVGEAILASIDQIEGNAYRGRDMKIDVSGDGRSNTGPDASFARNEAIARGITVNGLAILNAEAGLSEYYETEVIGGRNAFLIVAADYRDYAEAMRKKLIRELEIEVAEGPAPSRLAGLGRADGRHD